MAPSVYPNFVSDASVQLALNVPLPRNVCCTQIDNVHEMLYHLLRHRRFREKVLNDDDNRELKKRLLRALMREEIILSEEN
ncbi:hypothetical protein niasHT_037562 [Heterodera trifolii]|uniref:Uncharacterized protein n=1 Tax=Heterodera trifolii TaxID=157864 RepID=A0ABD2IKX4_9BILA